MTQFIFKKTKILYSLKNEPLNFPYHLSLSKHLFSRFLGSCCFAFWLDMNNSRIVILFQHTIQHQQLLGDQRKRSFCSWLKNDSGNFRKRSNRRIKKNMNLYKWLFFCFLSNFNWNSCKEPYLKEKIATLGG